MHNITLYSLILLLGFSCNTYAAECSKDRISYNPKSDTPKQQIKIGDYLISRSNHNELSVKKSGKLVYTDCDLNKEVEQESRHGDNAILTWDIRFKRNNTNQFLPNLPLAGTDITGNGIADLAIYYTYESATCCESVLIFELGQQFKKIAKIQGNTWHIEFKNVNKDNIPEILIHDDSCKSWYIDYTHGGYGYVKPKLILSWNGTDYELRPDLMRKPAPSKLELLKQAKQIRENPKWTQKHEHFDYVPLELIERAMDLMYSGHEALGWEFARLAWSNKVPVNEAFFNEWKQHMNNSRIWQAIVHNERLSAAKIQAAIEAANDF